MPMTKDSTTAETAMPRSSRVATIVRLKMSRPSASVPNQCAADGGLSVAAASLASGSKGTIHGPTNASSTNSPNRLAATSVTGFSAST